MPISKKGLILATGFSQRKNVIEFVFAIESFKNGNVTAAHRRQVRNDPTLRF
jgi:hypothetical protein